MRTLVSTAFISLDGVVEDPGGQSGYRNGGWTFTSVDFVPEAYALKGSEGGPIVIHGSVTLNHALADAGLIDRYHLLVFPLLLGAGERLFSDTDKDAAKLRLVDSEAFSNGIQENSLDVIH